MGTDTCVKYERCNSDFLYFIKAVSAQLEAELTSAGTYSIILALNLDGLY